MSSTVLNSLHIGHLLCAGTKPICQNLVRIIINTLICMAIKPKLSGGVWVRDSFVETLCSIFAAFHEVQE